MVVVATNEEYEIAKRKFKGQKIVKTGVGGLNVIKSLNKYRRNIKIINFGFCGSNVLPKGTTCVVGTSKMYHPNVEYEEPTYKIGGGIVCYTSNDFVLDTDIKEACIFDMELAYILALGFKNVKSIKVVSDNLNSNEYIEIIREKTI